MAVYTPIDAAGLSALLERYDIGALVGFHGISEGVENTNYRLETAHGRFILTIYEKRVAAGDLPFFIGLMDHLSARGLPCPVPVKDRRGMVLQEIGGKPAAIVSHLEGRSPRRLTPERCRTLGAALALLHEQGRDFVGSRPNALSIEAWRPLFESCRPFSDTLTDELVHTLWSELDRLEEHWPRQLPHGVIHADLFPDNVFFDGDRLTGMIDFYFACTDILAYDLAICLNAWCFEGREFNITKSSALIEGYRAQRPLSPAELEALPLLARGAAMRFFLTRLYDWQNRIEGALVTPKDPFDYLAKLAFHRRVANLGDYGIHGA